LIVWVGLEFLNSELDAVSIVDDSTIFKEGDLGLLDWFEYLLTLLFLREPLLIVVL
jgi:hypothetical protein